MNKTFIFILILIIPFGSTTTYSQATADYTVRRANTQLSIDGYLTESEWTNAKPTNNFVVLGNSEISAKTNTWAKLLWDDDYLYVGLYCQDHNERHEDYCAG